MPESSLNDHEPTILERKEVEARIAKLELERQLLSLQLSAKYDRRERLKMVASFGGFFAAIAAIATFSITVLRWQEESFDTRMLRIEERFDRALERLASESTGARLGGITSLKSFLSGDNRDRHSRVLLSLAQTLAIERDPNIQRSIIEVFTGINREDVNKESLDEALNSLIAANRAFVADGRLNRERVLGNLPPKGDSVEAQARVTALAIAALIRKGARQSDLSGIYCVNCDFSEQDLSSTKFNKALLDYANFKNATLVDASFQSAVLEGANFERADLRHAKLTINYTDRGINHGNLYSWDKLEQRLDEINYPAFPDFRCADLREADFYSQTLGISFKPDELGYRTFRANFDYANVEKANFEGIELFVIDEENNGPPNKYLGPETLKHNGKTYFIHKYDIIEGISFSDPTSDVAEVRSILRLLFVDTNWEQANLPRGILDYFRGPITWVSVSPSCEPRAPRSK